MIDIRFFDNIQFSYSYCKKNCMAKRISYFNVHARASPVHGSPLWRIFIDIISEFRIPRVLTRERETGLCVLSHPRNVRIYGFLKYRNFPPSVVVKKGWESEGERVRERKRKRSREPSAWEIGRARHNRIAMHAHFPLLLCHYSRTSFSQTSPNAKLIRR